MAPNCKADGIFSRFVEPGRLALVRYGPLENKLVTIVDMIDLRRVVIDGSGINDVARQQIPIKWLALTSLKCDAQRACSVKVLKKKIAAAGVVAKFNGSSWGKKIAVAAKKAGLSDFQRFQVMMAKKKVGAAVKSAVRKAVKK